MSSDHHGFQLPSAVDELHRQPPSPTTGNNLPDLTTPPLPHTPSPMVETNAPESPIPAALGDAIFTTPSTSFDGAATATTTTTVNTQNPVRQTLTDTNSSANQDPPTITTTPPNVSEPARRNTILRRSHSDPIRIDSQEHQMNKPPPSTVSATTKSRTSPPCSPTPKQISKSKAMMERSRDGCFGFQIRCRCGKKRKGMCTNALFVLYMILIFCFFLIIGISVSFHLIVSIL